MEHHLCKNGGIGSNIRLSWDKEKDNNIFYCKVSTAEKICFSEAKYGNISLLSISNVSIRSPSGLHQVSLMYDSNNISIPL